jgi:uncharacterized coiled-coil protein SlyX
MAIDLEKNMAELQKSQVETSKQIAETSKQIAETGKKMAETDAKLDRIGKMLGGISNSQGDVTEEFFYNCISDKVILGGIQYDFIEKNVTRRRNGAEDEYDILLVNGKDVAIVETKYKAHHQDLKRLLESKYPNFKKLYPEYKDYCHHLNLASFHISDEIKELALESGVNILQRKGDILETTLSH